MSFSVQLQTETKVTRNQTSEEEIMHLFMLTLKIFDRHMETMSLLRMLLSLYMPAASLCLLLARTI